MHNVESLCSRIWCTPGRIQRPRDLLQTSGSPRSSPRSPTKVVDTANGSWDYDPLILLLGGSAQTPRARAAIHGWEALQTEQAVSYNRSRSFVAILDHQPVPENSLGGDRSTPSSCGERPNVESAGTVTSRRQHLPVRREVRPEEVRCLRPTPAVHFRPLPAAVCAVCPLSALLTHCIAVVWQ